MTTRVRFHADFRADFRKHLARLADHGEDARIDALRAGIDEGVDLLSRHPRAGTSERSDDRAEVRRLVLRRVPYVVWHAVDGGDVWLMRLFHSKQKRGAPTWPPERSAPSAATKRVRSRRRR